MKKILLWSVIGLLLVGCKNEKKSDNFVVKGKITNNPGEYIFLEEIPVATMQRVVVDSVKIGKDGSFKLSAEPRESSVYNLRIDQQTYPIAQVVNDASPITVDATFNNDNRQFVETYDVKGSPISLELKDFMSDLNKKLQNAFELDRALDSLQSNKASDSLIRLNMTQRASLSNEMRAVLDNAIKTNSNPALVMTILGYYQSTANNPGFKLSPVSNEDVVKIVNDVAAKFPNHQGVASIKSALDAQSRKATGWVGQTAPEISLPDVNGKEIKLSSFKGKYVLVDFWASWCRPCRAENPNVVKAFNKYNSKNFTILGVSLDRPGEKEQWLGAIREDKLNWTHVSDLAYWNSAVVPLYAIDGIPFNVLVDPTGKIIAQGLRGEELDARLGELLK